MLSVVYNDPFIVFPFRLYGLGFAFGEAVYRRLPVGTLFLGETIARCYILAHTIHRAFNAQSNVAPAVIAFDTLIHDGFSCAFFPPVLAYHVYKIFESLMGDLEFLPMFFRKNVPAVISLAAVWYTYPHFDELVEKFMNETIRQVY
ncbi:uncharacterized protein LOC131951908 [Physella acuta]|uniref:uncharacterized protein LOC131951908 n=1 Tax=Physella acuta TaxID=109671 RepID=UPI0027DCACE0|nr:uncharacterized protein LOC131951908 [Physella acuta]